MNELLDDKDLVDTLNKIIELRKYYKSTDKKAIKKVLLEAKKLAPQEITALEWSNNETHIVDLEKIPLEHLYRKIRQYQKGLKNHCLIKISEEKIEEYIKQYNKGG